LKCVATLIRFGISHLCTHYFYRKRLSGHDITSLQDAPRTLLLVMTKLRYFCVSPEPDRTKVWEYVSVAFFFQIGIILFAMVVGVGTACLKHRSQILQLK
ncbi:MAG: hypothetical protein V7K89_27350, partial [Nostoc sp.]|uniref:hypothetical protein n=1 Tax=Nostoc sp. TaxID=1180 RepID=UPI002FF7AC8D